VIGGKQYVSLVDMAGRWPDVHLVRFRPVLG